MDKNHSRPPITRRTFLKQFTIGVAATFTALLGGVKMAEIVDWIDVNEWNVGVKRFPAALSGLKILHLTDIHVSEWMTPTKLSEIKELLKTINYDLVLVTGDLTYHTADVSSLVDFFDELLEKTPVIMVMGNHDIWDGGEKIFQPLFDHGVRLLKNEFINFGNHQEPFYIAGLGCVFEAQDDIKRLLSELPDDGPALLMVHEPDVAPKCAQEKRFFLQISGHSHGGQVCLPGGFSPVLPWLAQKFPKGFYQVDDMMLYTCRGLGRSKPFVRVNCPAEIAVYHLVRSETAYFKKHHG